MSKEQLILYTLMLTKEAHLETDKKNHMIRKTCESGCDSCCHQIVNTITWEEPEISHFLHTKLDIKTKQKIISNIKNWLKTFNNYIGVVNSDKKLNLKDYKKIHWLFREKKIPCPLLINSECSIYNVRPMYCRVHYSNSIEQCLSNPHKSTPYDAQEVFYQANQHFKNEIFFSGMKPLSYLAAKELNIEINSKINMEMKFNHNTFFLN